MNQTLRNRLFDICIAIVAVLVGAGIVYFGDKLLGVNLETFYGVDTFTVFWVMDLFLVPFIAGIEVSLIYGHGGKILAHLSPVIVRVASYYELHGNVHLAVGGVSLPIPYWLLVVVVAAEFAAGGGGVGVIVIIKTYGRTAKHLLHKKYQRPQVDKHMPPKPSVEGVVFCGLVLFCGCFCCCFGS